MQQHPRQSLTAQAGLLGELMTGAMQPVLNEIGITLATFELLSAVKAGNGSLPQAELARRLGVSAPTLCEAVKAACTKGLVEQKPHPTDARSKVLTLSKSGAKVVSKVLERVNIAEQEMVEGIGDQELRAAIEVLRRINRNLARSLSDAPL